MEFENLRAETDGAVRTITLDRPRHRNALSLAPVGMIYLMHVRLARPVQRDLRLILIKQDVDTPDEIPAAQVAQQRGQVDVRRIQVLVDRTIFLVVLMHKLLLSQSL